MPSSVSKMAVLFIDTDARSIYNQGWIARLRKKEGEADFELSYKKRYGRQWQYRTSLSLANTEGFSSKDSNYEAQVEWDKKQTLSNTNSKFASKDGIRDGITRQKDAIASVEEKYTWQDG